MARRLLAIVMGLFCAANVLRCALALQQAAQLPDLVVSPPPTYTALFGAVWAIGFGAAAWAVWARKRWGGILAIVAVVAYHAHLLLDRFAFAQAPTSNATLGFNVALSGVAVAVVVALVALDAFARARREARSD